MGSRVMHAIIACQIAKRVPAIKDKNSFVVGGIAPDAASFKEASHFYAGDIREFTRRIEFNRFLDKYESQKDHSYILGYYTHLIADDLWLSGFYLPWLRNRMEANNEVLHLYHRDFWLLNGKLLDHYGNKDLIRSYLKDAAVIDLEEVRKHEVEALKPYLLEDMNYQPEDIRKELTVFTFEQIVGYIETSIEKGNYFIQRILNDKGNK